mgnify:CR=1 FL=1
MTIINPKKINPGIAELAGFFAADGSMSENHISFWGNPESDKLFYDFYLKKII